MASPSSPPLDELQHRRADIIDWWVNDMGGKPMDENMIHRYLAESPFFDHSTKNGLHFLHARTNMAEFELTKDRRRFEEDLRKHVGSEYLIVGEPQDIPKRAVPGGGVKAEKGERESSGIYVLRKQQRDRSRAVDGRVEEALTTLGTYYLVGENMYQAPSVGDLVGNRLLSATTNLSKFFDTAASLPSFSPTAGYTYLPQSTQPTAAGTSSHASPTRSREGSVLPGVAAAGADSQSLRSGSLPPDTQSLSNPSSSNTQDSHLLAQSFKHALEFSDEYTDENPLHGEPGHFTFTSSLAAVSKRKRRAADEEAAALAAKARQLQLEQQRVFTTNKDAVVVKVEEENVRMVVEPPAVMNTAQTKERRGSKMGERKRRQKSRPNVGSLVGAAEGAAG